MDSKTKPQGSAASWGMVKGQISRSPMENLWPARKYSTAGSQVGSWRRDSGVVAHVAFLFGLGGGELEGGVGIVGAVQGGVCSFFCKGGGFGGRGGRWLRARAGGVGGAPAQV